MKAIDVSKPHIEYNETGQYAHAGYCMKVCRVCGIEYIVANEPKGNVATCGRRECRDGEFNEGDAMGVS
jgi:hypothetical protein